MKKLLSILFLLPCAVFATSVSDLLPQGVALSAATSDANWIVVTKDGKEVLRSGEIGGDDTSILEISVEGKGKLSFEWSVSSEANYDCLICTYGPSSFWCIDGVVDWTAKTIEFKDDGLHRVRFSYEKDETQAYGSDCGWVRNITWTPPIQRKWEYRLEKGKAIITGVESSAGELDIPAKIDGYPVVGIGREAFYSRRDITSVIIPEGVTTIAEGAFAYCEFKSITIPRTLNSIGDYAFAYCYDIEDVNISDMAKWCEIEFTDYDSNPIAYASARNVCLRLNGAVVNDVVIPNTATRVGPFAFYSSKITSLNIGNGVRSIGKSAFSGCRSLESVTIGTGLESLDDHAFERCDALKTVNIKDVGRWCAVSVASSYDSTPLGSGRTLCLYGTPITNLTVPEGVESIGPRAFYRCSGITALNLPDTLTNIDSNAFYGCSGVSSVKIPSGVTNLGYYAFANCSGLSSIEIPDSVRSVGEYAFSYCSSLKTVSFGSGLESVGRDAFSGCNALSRVDVADLTKWCAIEFGGTGDDYYIYPSANPLTTAKHLYVDGKEVTELAIPEGVASIGRCAFYMCSSITSVSFPESLKSIGAGAFHGCTGLTSLKFPSGLAAFRSYAFRDCTGLTSIEILNLNPTFYSDAFRGCEAITSVVVPGSLKMSAKFPDFYKTLKTAAIVDGETKIIDSAFEGCASLESVIIPDTVVSIGNGAFKGCNLLADEEGFLIVNNVLFGYTGSASAVVIPDGVVEISQNAFLAVKTMRSVSIPNTVRVVGAAAFKNCTGLSSIEFSDKITSIGDSVCSGCSKLSSVRLPASLIAIGASWFENCSSLGTVTIPDGVISIGASAFKNCESMTEVAFPAVLSSIGGAAFAGCLGLTRVDIPSGVTNIGSSAFGSCSGLTAVYVSDLSKWCEISFGGDYANPLRFAGRLYLNGEEVIHLTIPNGVKDIPSYVFDGCKYITALTIPQGVETIGDVAFRYCSGLKKIELPDGLMSMGWGAFYGCSSLEGVVFPQCMNDIGTSAFYGCSSLKSVTLPSGLQTVSGKLFYDCNSLESVEVPNGVDSIGESAFSGCQSLRSVNIPDSVTSVGREAFVGTPIWNNSLTDLIVCDGCVLGLTYEARQTKKTLTIPEGARIIADYAFNGNDVMESVNFPQSLSFIGYCAFYKCTRLANVVLPEGLLSIGKEAFAWSDGLKTVSIPGTVKEIGASAFAYSRYMEKITMGEGVETIGASAFEESGYQTGYWGHGGIKISLPSTIKSIGDRTFNWTGYKTIEVTLGDMGKWCEANFGGSMATPWYNLNGCHCNCEVYPELKIPYGPERIAAYAFANWPYEISVPSSVTTIESNAFYQSYMDSIRIPASVEKIDYNAFKSCSRLKTVYVYPNDAERVKSMMSGKGVDVSTLKFVEFDPPEYCITLDDNLDGSQSTVLKVYEGASAPDFPLLEGDGYAFMGWFSKAKGGDRISSIDHVVSDMTLFAHWEQKSLSDLIRGATDVVCTGDGTWFAKWTGSEWVLQSGAIADRQMSTLSCKVDGAGALTFKWKVSSDCAEGWHDDYLNIEVDGQEVAWIGGEKGWIEQRIELSANDKPHEVKWNYIKDKDVSAGDDCGWLKDVVWTPDAVAPTFVELAKVFGEDSEVVKNITDETELATFNGFLKDCSIMTADDLTEGQKRYAYQSFKLEEITTAPQLFEEEPVLKIDDLELTGGNLSLTISLMAGAEAIQLAKDKLAEKIRVGTTLGDITGKPTIVASPAADGTSLTFTITPPEGNQGFVKVQID